MREETVGLRLILNKCHHVPSSNFTCEGLDDGAADRELHAIVCEDLGSNL